MDPDQKSTYHGGWITERNAESLPAWPCSGMMSGCVAMYQATGDKSTRRCWRKASCRTGTVLGRGTPSGMLSGVVSPPNTASMDATTMTTSGLHWIVALVSSTHHHKADYLKKTIALYEYIYSGWSDRLSGRNLLVRTTERSPKHTCSMLRQRYSVSKLYRLTKDKKYLDKAKETRMDQKELM